MTGNGLIDKIIMGLTVLVGSLIIGVFVYTTMLYQKDPIDEQDQLNRLKTDSKLASLGETYKINQLIINLNSETSRLRFLDITPHFVTFKKEHIDLLTKNESIVSDTVITVAGKMDPEELNTVAGKILLESRIKKELNRRLNTDAVKEIYFAKFVIQ